MRCLTLGFFVLLGGLVGCDVNVSVDGKAKDKDMAPAEGSTDGDDEGFSLQIPGAGVDIKGKDGKWDVQAPGTKVDTDLNTGETKVEAPGTSVDVK